MKRIYFIFSILLSAMLVACSNSDEMTANDMGYLTLDVAAVNSTNDIATRALPSNYNAKRWAVEIVNAAGEVVQQTDDFNEWSGQKLSLRAGKYTVKAHSAGWDGADSGRDNPYYAGQTEVNVKATGLVTAQVVCTLANVKVSVRFDNSVATAFAVAMVEVSSAISGVNDIWFRMGDPTTIKPAYFPVGNLTAKLTVVNKGGESHEMTTQINDVKARDHYILHYKTAETGTGKFEITADDEEKSYTYTFSVPTKSSTTLVANAANAWSTFAYVNGSIPASAVTIDNSKVVFQYKAAGASTWTTQAAAFANDTYTAKITDLQPATTYSYKMTYVDDTNNFSSAEQTFTTEGATPLPNGNMDSWYTDSYPYPCSAEDYKNGKLFWDTSNAGSAIMRKVVTSGESSIVHTAGGMSAKLASTKVLTTIAAASLYVGSFGATNMTTQTAKVNFGRPFASRPSALKGWFRYSTSNIDVVGKNLPSSLGVVQGSTRDLWSCYWALMTEAFTFDNGNIAGTSVDWENDPRVIAYGILPDNECIETTEWTEFNIPLTYRTLNKPANMVLVLVLSASKYGDYMTGSTSSVLYVDDLELVYDEPQQ